MALIWAGGVIGLAIVAALLRLLMGLAGLTGHRIDALSAQTSISMRQPLASSRSPHPFSGVCGTTQQQQQ
jgi:hypothetical protein